MIKYDPKKTNILIAMAKRGYNQSALSKASNLDKTSVSLFLNGKRNISPTSAKRIAVALEQDIEELFEIRIMKEEVNV